MNRHNEVCCKFCGNPLFFIPENYQMGIDIICIPCGKSKTKRKKKKKTKEIRTASANYARTKKGIRKDIHPTYVFRSATEANVARLLTHLGVTWTFEERTFNFNNYKSKPYSYLMDFQIQKVDRRKKAPEEIREGYIEVKGWMNPASRQKLRRLVKNYPEDAAKTTVIIYDKYRKKDIEFCTKLGYKFLFYDVLTKEYSSQIQGWE